MEEAKVTLAKMLRVTDEEDLLIFQSFLVRAAAMPWRCA